ncbi:hypothetical protein NP233_g11682 [Leucocoprinus birnbaumii]|uniref:Uncharacterized protein n=1 Tax=Leucocoprinus birnbaumii TaxID=56174 RepID=A0AAD5YQQ0_9AGAR|nr:hypothetical protein NP233_g11682 [Leucocoprinus birnbaumii]
MLTELEKMDKAISDPESGPYGGPVVAFGPPPSGLTWVQFHDIVQKWLIFHNTTFLVATAQSLRLPQEFNRLKTHILFIRTEWRDDNEGKVGKYFRLVDAKVMTIREAWIDPFLRLNVEAFLDTQRENDALDPLKGSTIGFFFQNLPLGQTQLQPFTSVQKSMISLMPMIDWESILRDRLERGIKF